MDEMEAIETALATIYDATLLNVYVSLISSSSEFDTDELIVKLKTICLWYDSGKYMTKD